ncbi:V-type ATP synthase subunit D [Dactylosporangium sp. NPDC049140]|jgi:V/A-type H+-transporting ATPase subunit D|uniref:V-type ATP synthase subunit D n=1 Tax=Dactylosporangium sp. NPDC049140 TaxID=3155647 RepID=UPI0033DCD832
MSGVRGAPPGRAGALWLRRRLAVARRGSDVLRRKVAMLTAQRQRLRERADATGLELVRADATARTWLRRTAALDGADAFCAAAADAPPLTFVPRWITLLGVRCAEPPDLPGAGAPPMASGGAALAAAVAAYRDAAATAVRHAAAMHALISVETALSAARQRVRALERRWIPRLEAGLAATESQLAELEVADTVRRIRAVPRR